MKRKLARTFYVALCALTLLGVLGTAREFALNANQPICKGGCSGPSDCAAGCDCNTLGQCYYPG
jgi:hypothetical protein